jgi:ABC-type Fe3+/spermidine/putrescine transport system ATPase subunit
MVQSVDRPYSGHTGIELKNIKKSFGSLTVLSNLSLTIRQAELLCLLGPSGCGKTTALKIINGLLESDSGSVYIDNQDITGVAPQKRNLGMVFQNYALFPHMSVFDNVAYGLRRRHLPENEIKEKVGVSLALVRLQGYETRRIYELSGGQQQRVALARALVIEPRALLLDEPLSNLDARLRTDMRDEIRRIQKELDITTVYVTHDQEEAMSIADRIVVMNNGNIEQTGTPEEIYEQPATVFVASFIGNINLIPGEITGDTLLLLEQRYPVSPGITASGTVSCAVRPERIRINKIESPGIRGFVTKKSYFGSNIRYEIGIGSSVSGQMVTVQVPVSSEKFDKDDIVNLSIDYGDIRLFGKNSTALGS